MMDEVNFWRVVAFIAWCVAVVAITWAGTEWAKRTDR